MKSIIDTGEAMTLASMIERKIGDACQRIATELAEALSSKIDHDMVIGAIEELMSNSIDSMVEDAIESAVDTYDTQDRIYDCVSEKIEELLPDSVEDQVEDTIGRMVDQAGIPDQIRRAIADLTDRMNYLDQEIEEVRGVAAAVEAERQRLPEITTFGARLRWLLTGR
jgi:DNA repair ATPase RecN